MSPVPSAAGRGIRIPPSPHFEPISLGAAYNARRSDLAPELAPPDRFGACHGLEVIRGVPFDFGSTDAPDVVLLDDSPVSIELHDRVASYLVFVHAVQDRPTNYLPGFADSTVDGLELGDHVSDYVVSYADGGEAGCADAAAILDSAVTERLGISTVRRHCRRRRRGVPLG